MSTYIMATKLTPDALARVDTIEDLNRAVEERLRHDCPSVRWIANYATLGPYDYVDVFEAPSDDDAMNVSLIIRSFGHATTETWPATPWDRFVEIAKAQSARRAEAARPADTEYLRVRMKGTASE